MTSWFEKHQRSRASVDAKKKSALVNLAEQRSVREASWESRAAGVVQRVDIARRIVARKEKLAQELNKRRHRLAALLESERLAYAQELENSIETSEQRRARMIAEARHLAQKREERRVAGVGQIRAEQFKDGLDEFRVLKSRAIKMNCHKARQATIEAKKHIVLAQQKEEAKIHEEYMKFGQKMLEREIKEAAQLKARNARTKEIVARQAAEKRALREAQEAEKQRDVEAWRRRLDAANLKEKNKVEAAAAATAANLKEMFAQNALKLERMKLAKAKIKKQEEAMLQVALAAEKQEVEKDKAHTAERAQEAKRFQAFLLERSQETQDDELELENVLKAENDKAWAQKEKVWNANKAAKEKLAVEVDKGRQLQLQSKKAAAAKALMEKELAKQELIRLNELGLLADKAKAAKKQEQVDAYRNSLKVDMSARKVREAAAAAALVAEKEEMTEDYRRFDENLAAVMGTNYQPPTHYRKKKVEWYF